MKCRSSLNLGINYLAQELTSKPLSACSSERTSHGRLNSIVKNKHDRKESSDRIALGTTGKNVHSTNSAEVLAPAGGKNKKP
jgi:hypothetical protein